MKLIHWDCLEEMDKLIAEWVKVDAIITDPPYWTTACKWDTVIPFDAMWERLNKLIKPNGAIVLFGSEPFSSALRMSNIKQYKYDWKWDKIKGSSSMLAKIMPLKNYEDIIIFWIGKINYFPIMTDSDKKNIRNRQKNFIKPHDWSVYWKTQWYIWDAEDKKRYPKSIISISAQSNELHQSKKVHPTQKPVALIEYLIKTYTNEWETVLDFTMWSWTTGVACKNLGREFIGIEKEQEYVDIANKRLNNIVV